MFPLPQVPQVNTAVGVSGGGGVNPMIPPGTQAYRPSIPAELTQGVSSFMQNYLSMRNVAREANKQKFFDAVQKASQGIPIDTLKAMKYAKKGGLDYLQTEPPTQQEQDYTQAQQAQATGQMMASQGQQGPAPGGMMAPAGLPGMGPQSQFVANPQTNAALAAGPGPGQPPPSFGQRVLQNMGLRTPQVSNASPMGQWLQQLQQAGQTGGGAVGDIAQQRTLSNLEFGFQKQFGFPVRGMEAQKEAQLIDLTRNAMGGDPASIQQMARMSNGWQLPMDELQYAMKQIYPGMNQSDISKGAADLYLKLKMGYPQYQLKMLDIGKDLAPNFNNDPRQAMAWVTGQPGAQPPAMSPQQWEQFNTGLRPWLEAYPTMQDTNIPLLLGASYITPGGETWRQPIINALSGRDAKGNPNFPRAGSIELQKHYDLLGKDYSQIASTFNLGMSNLNWEKMMGVRKYDQETFDKFWGVAMDSKQPTQAREAAWQELSKLSQKTEGTSIDYNGQKIPIGNPFQVSGGWSWMGQTHSPFSGTGPYGAPINQGMPFSQTPSLNLGAQGQRQPGPEAEVIQKVASMSVAERQAMLVDAQKFLPPTVFEQYKKAIMAVPAPEMQGPPEPPAPYVPPLSRSLEGR